MSRRRRRRPDALTCPYCAHEFRGFGNGGGRCPNCEAFLWPPDMPTPRVAQSGMRVYARDGDGWRRVPSYTLTTPREEAP